MQTALLPSPVCVKIDSLCRRFLWGSIDSKRIHLCNWAQVCKAKYAGGLGLHFAVASNLAFMAKIGVALIFGRVFVVLGL